MSWGGDATLGGVAEASVSSCRTSKVNYWKEGEEDGQSQWEAWVYSTASTTSPITLGRGQKPKRPNINERGKYKHGHLIY